MAGDDSEPIVAPTAVYNYWKEFDLESLRARLDEKGLAIAESQESSVKARKQLAEKTKEFKRSVPPEVFKQMSTLLKAYQEEVDSLTGRAKLAEGAFLDVFKQLYEAPDPAPAIAQGLELATRAAELEAAAAKTAAELAEYVAESRELRNQDLTIRRLEETVRGLEAELAEKEGEVDAARAAAAAELQARDADEAREREGRLEAELQRAEAALEAMRRMHQTTQSQLFSLQERGEEAAAAARAEADLAAAEVERAEERLALLANERDALLVKVGAGEGGSVALGDLPAEPAALAALREELRVQRDLASRLQAELSTTTRSAEGELAAAQARLAGAQASLAAAEAHAAALEAELAGRPTLAELEDARHQIRILNAVVHNAVGEDFEGDSGGGGGGAAGAGNGNGAAGEGPSSRSLESALLVKNRHLEHKLTMARLEASEAQGAAETAAARVAELEADLERRGELIAKLEEDLLAAERATEGVEPANGAAAAGGDGETPLSPTRSGLLDASGEATMVAVLSGQRDRLRARLHELESASASTAAALAKAKQDVAAARADNVALVEQLRYVQQGYAGSGKARAGDVEAGTAGTVIGKYLADYEDRVNPLNDFRSREREARRRAMSVQDRAAVALGSTLVSGSRVARGALAAYVFLLHLVAFLVLAGFSHRHVDKMEALEEMCATMGGAGAGGVGVVGVVGEDPVIGGGVAAAVDAVKAALRRI